MSMPGTTPVIAPVTPTDDIDLYASHQARYGHGGYRSVLSYAERDGIPMLRREAGMMAFVREDWTAWRLLEDLVTWEEAEVSDADCDFRLLGTDGGLILTNDAGDALGLECIQIRYVRADGDTMTGPLILSENPTAGSDAMQAAPQQWVLDQIQEFAPELPENMAGVIEETLAFVDFSPGVKRAVSTTDLKGLPADASLWVDGDKCASGLVRDTSIPGHRFAFFIGSQVSYTQARAVITLRI